MFDDLNKNLSGISEPLHQAFFKLTNKSILFRLIYKTLASLLVNFHLENVFN